MSWLNWIYTAAIMGLYMVAVTGIEHLADHDAHRRGADDSKKADDAGPETKA